MNRRNLPIALEIARTALIHQATADLIARELDLSDAELDRIFSEIEKTLALPYYQPMKGDK
jgi:hypothetical protein